MSAPRPDSLLPAMRAGDSPYGLQLLPLAEHEAGWQLVAVRHLAPAKNREGHHLYVRVEGGMPEGIEVVSEDGARVLPLKEGRIAPFPMMRRRRYTVRVAGAPSEGVANIHIEHPDEGPGNRLFRHSFELVFGPHRPAPASAEPPAAEAPVPPSSDPSATPAPMPQVPAVPHGTLVLRLVGGIGRVIAVRLPGGSSLTVVLPGDEWQWEQAPPGTYEITLDDHSTEVTLAEGQTRIVELGTAHDRLAGVIRGRIRQASGLPAAGVELLLWQGGQPLQRTTSGAAGDWRFGPIPPGDYEVSPGQAPTIRARITLGAGDIPRFVVLQLPPPAPAPPLTTYLLLGTPGVPETTVALLALREILVSRPGLVVGFRVDEAAKAARVGVIAPVSQIPDATLATLVAAGVDVTRFADSTWTTLRGRLLSWLGGEREAHGASNSR